MKLAAAVMRGGIVTADLVVVVTDVRLGACTVGRGGVLA